MRTYIRDIRAKLEPWHKPLNARASRLRWSMPYAHNTAAAPVMRHVSGCMRAVGTEFFCGRFVLVGFFIGCLCVSAVCLCGAAAVVGHVGCLLRSVSYLVYMDIAILAIY